MQARREILCTACGAETFVRPEPVYEGFRKTGERFVCVACGHGYEQADAVPFTCVRGVRVFDAADRPDPVNVFQPDERRRGCRYCRHYVTNPFAQRCGRHGRFVEATDLCGDFELMDGASRES